MKKILIVPVNYNSYDYLDAYLKSVSEAWNLARGECELTVFIADNSTHPQEIDIAKYNLPDLRTVSLDNLGYFGGALHVINNCVNVIDYDYIIISNVDMTFDKTAIKCLINLKTPKNTGWISPYRYSEKYGKYIYVEKSHRPSKIKLWLQMQIYRSRWLLGIQQKMVGKRYRSAEIIERPESEIYMGCGSCFILTSTFFKKYPTLEYPVFLYGEELFIAELCRIANLKVMYEPSVKVVNVGAVSTGELPSASFLKFNHEAIKYIYNRFFLNN